MRDEITFLPPRISIVSSIGINTRPILSWSVNASTRLSRLSFTFFSKPEYVWMMYHCIAIGFYDLSNSKNFEHVRDASLDQPVDHRQKNAEERHRRDHDGGGRDDFFAARPSDCLHLQANVVQKLTRLLDRAGDLTADFARSSADTALRIVVFHFYRLRSHRSSSLLHRLAPGPDQSLAGEEGLEPPYPVLETGVLAVGRLPFTLSPPKGGQRVSPEGGPPVPRPTSEPAQTSYPGSSPLLVVPASALP